jgi:hypothetical protein
MTRCSHQTRRLLLTQIFPNTTSTARVLQLHRRQTTKNIVKSLLPAVSVRQRLLHDGTLAASDKSQAWEGQGLAGKGRCQDATLFSTSRAESLALTDTPTLCSTLISLLGVILSGTVPPGDELRSLLAMLRTQPDLHTPFNFKKDLGQLQSINVRLLLLRLRYECLHVPSLGRMLMSRS